MATTSPGVLHKIFLTCSVLGVFLYCEKLYGPSINHHLGNVSLLMECIKIGTFYILTLIYQAIFFIFDNLPEKQMFHQNLDSDSYEDNSSEDFST